MHRFILVLAALAVTVSPLSLSSTVVADNDFDDVADFFQMLLEMTATSDLTDAQLRAKYRMWNMLCLELRDVDCTGMNPPQIKVFQPNPLRPGLQGYYDGTNIIYIRSNLRGHEREEVMGHEMSHYVDQKLGLLPPMPVYSDDVEGIIKLCTSEAVAWAFSDAFNSKYGYDEKIVGESWTEWYTHCTPYKDEIYPRT